MAAVFQNRLDLGAVPTIYEWRDMAVTQSRGSGLGHSYVELGARG